MPYCSAQSGSRMPKPSIFISYSSKGPGALPRVEAVAAALEPQFEPWLDRKSLRPGFWHKQLSEALTYCRAAVVLIDDSARRTRFVAHEVSVLLTRAQVEADFSFFPIIVDPQLTVEDLGDDDSLTPKELDALQIWTPAAADMADDARLAAAIAAKVNGEIGPLGDPDPRRARIIRKIRGALSDVKDDAFDEALEAVEHRAPPVAEALRDAIAARNPMRRRWLLAKWLVDQAQAQLPPVIEFLKPFYRAVREPKDLKDLLEMINAAEAYWLGSFDPNCPIYRKTLSGQHGGVVAVNGVHVADYTIHCFAHRALTPNSEFVVVTCDEGCLSAGQVVASIQSKLGHHGAPATLEKVRGRSREWPTICVLPQRFISGVEDTEALDELHRLFPSIVFVVWPGPIMDELLVPDAAARINPAVDLALEGTRHGDWVRLSDAIQV